MGKNVLKPGLHDKHFGHGTPTIWHPCLNFRYGSLSFYRVNGNFIGTGTQKFRGAGTMWIGGPVPVFQGCRAHIFWSKLPTSWWPNPESLGIKPFSLLAESYGSNPRWRISFKIKENVVLVTLKSSYHCTSLHVPKTITNQASDRKRTQILVILGWFTAASTAWTNILRLLTLL